MKLCNYATFGSGKTLYVTDRNLKINQQVQK